MTPLSPQSLADTARRSLPTFRAPPPAASASPLWPFVAGAALGALCMYLADPVSGRRRRSTTKQSASRLGRINATRPAKKKLKDLSNRAQGLTHRLLDRQPEDGDQSDARLVQRVRTALGRLSEAPEDIEVQVEGGHVELTGRIGRMEQRAVVHGVKRVRGIEAVTNRMEAYDENAAESPGRGEHKEE